MTNVQRSQMIPFFSLEEAQTDTHLHVDLPFLQFYNKKILLLSDENSLPNDLTQRLEVDYLILTQNTKVSLKRALDWLDVRERVVFDTSNDYHKIQRWESECELYGINCYNVYDRGAFVMEF